MSHDTNDRGDGHATAAQNTVQHEWEEPFHPSVTIVEAVAAATGTEPTELPALQKHVDSDALDTLVSQGELSEISISFEYAGTDVVIEGNGIIEVRVDQRE